MYQVVDGKTSGSNAFHGELCTAVSVNLADLEIVKFNAIKGSVIQLPDDIAHDLSCD